MKKVLLFLYLFLFSTISADINGPFRNLIHRSWSSDEGLPQNSIYSIFQDSKGFVWIGTAEGLVQFDGSSFKLYDKYASPAFKSNVILAIYESDDKCLYIGLRNGGLVKKCGEDFKQFSVSDGLTSNTVTSIVRLGDKLFLGTFGGKISVMQDSVITPFSKNSFLPDSFIHDMAVSPDGALYVATDEGLYAISKDTVTRFGTDEGLPEQKVRNIFFDSNKDMWVGTSDSGIAVFREDGVTLYNKKNGLVSDRVFAIQEDSTGRIWVGTVGGGISVIDKDNISNFGKNDGLTSDIVRVLFKDRENNMWAGTFGGGINLFRKGVFSSISSNNGLSDNVIFALLESSNGDIYAGTYGKGLNIVRPDGTVKILNSSNGLSGDIPGAIHEDSSGRIWIGSYGTGLDIIEKDGKISHYGQKDGLEMNTIVSIFEDSHGTVILGGFDSSLAFYKNGKFNTFSKEGILKNRTVWSITQGLDGSILLGTDGAGIVKMKDNEFTVLDRESGLSDNKITAIHKDTENIIWAGTYDNGINIITPAGKISHVKKENGLFDDTIYSVVEDDAGNLWMSSNKGLFYVSKKDLLDFAQGTLSSVRSKVFSWKDGMPSNECNGGFQKAGIKTRDGRLMFPTIKGIAVMDPSIKKELPFVTRPVITSVTIDGKREETDSNLILEPGTSKIRVEYTAPVFSTPEKIKFRYRLSGFDKEWIYAQGSRVAEYMNLEPGEYVFEVGVTDIDGNWSESPEKISIIQKPAFHQHVMFRLMILILAGFIIFIPVSRKIRKMEVKNEELADLVIETKEEMEQIKEELDSKYASSSLSEEDMNFYKETLEKYMKDEKPYLDNELSIRKLAELLEMQPHHLSQVINSGFNNNFYTYINNYRINEVIDLMKDPKRKHHTILAIAYDSGFKSKSSFNTIFKKMTGKTPSEFRDEIDKKV
ncbi:MAG TPA: two-component regulator propeller domain-containing protein [bacterium]|nr:two-component regulator propeller domain-containing protein [bacterium]